jgi:hypothetical protein
MPMVPRTWRIDKELNLMDRYLEYLASYFQTQREDLVGWIERMAEGLDEEERHYLYEDFQDDLAPLEKSFPHLFYSSFVMSWYSFIETSLLRICMDYDLRIEITAQDRGLSESGIYRAKKFLRDAAGYAIDETHWRELQAIHFVRNKLVHEQGMVSTYSDRPDDDSRHHYEAVEGFPFYVEVDNHRLQYLQRFSLLVYKGPTFILVPSLNFCQHLVDFAREMLHKIYGDLETVS